MKGQHKTLIKDHLNPEFPLCKVHPTVDKFIKKFRDKNFPKDEDPAKIYGAAVMCVGMTLFLHNDL